MQSEPTEVSKTSTNTTVPASRDAYFQHGTHTPHQPGSRLSSLGEERDDSGLSAGEADSSVASAPHLDRTIESSSEGKRTESPLRTHSPVDRIAEYERALTASQKRQHDGPGFRVVDRKKKTRDEGLSIAAFPNGKLNGSLGLKHP